MAAFALLALYRRDQRFAQLNVDPTGQLMRKDSPRQFPDQGRRR